MRLVVQRVQQASVEVEGKIVGQIGKGLLVFLGIHKDDKAEDTRWLINKLLNLRIFEDQNGKMNLSLLDIKGEALVVSQFTLYGNCANGRRPDFIQAAPPDRAQPIYNKFIKEIGDAIGKVQTGIFGASMAVSLVNDGPVTMIISTPNF
jgi:D-aminoacyl-tRNA deacylase